MPKLLKICNNCGETKSPAWRRSFTLAQTPMRVCNACGLFEKRHGRLENTRIKFVPNQKKPIYSCPSIAKNPFPLPIKKLSQEDCEEILRKWEEMKQ